jgi:hypothetical protein
METVVASVVCQLSCTWSPAATCAGVALNCAVGAGAIAAGAVSEAGTCFGFFPQPATVIKATRRTTGTKIRLSRFNGLLLWGIKFVLLNDQPQTLQHMRQKALAT